MAISTIRIGRCYRRLLSCSSLDCRGIRKQRTQRDQRTEIGYRMRRAAHRPAERGIEHPGRDFLRASNAVIDETAPRRRTGRSLDELMDAHRLRNPRMPSVGNLSIAEHRSTVGVLSSSSITEHVLTLRWTRMLRSTDLRTPSGVSHQSPGSAASIASTSGSHNRQVHAN